MLNPDYRTIACKLIRGESFDWPENLSEQEFIDFAQSQGVLLLLSDHLEQIEQSCPKSMYQAIVIAQVAGMKLLEHRLKVIHELFEKLQQHDIKALLFKGAANAYLIYPKPILRQHADIDVLINVKDYSQMAAVLEQIGFEVDDIKPTKFGPYQTTAILQQKEKPDVIIDLHWKINNRLLLADKLSVNDAWDSALPIVEYGEQMRGLDNKNALLAACIHEAGSLPVEREKLIGLYDVYLLIDKLGGPAVMDVINLAKEKQISQICVDYIKKAVATFGGDQDKQILAVIDTNCSQRSNEPSSGLLKQKRSWHEDQRLDWLALQGVGNKLEYIISKISRKI